MLRYILIAFIGIACLGAGDEKTKRVPDVEVEKNGSAVDVAMNSRLDSKLPEINFSNNSLVDTIDFLRDVTGTNIFVNWKALEAVKITKETPVTCKLKDVKFSQALKLILDSVSTKEAKLSSTIEEGVIVISTVEDLDGTNIKTKKYDIKFALGDADKATKKKRTKALIKMITSSIAPRSWKPGDAKSEQIAEEDGQLVVKQSESNHNAIANLLEQLQVMMK